MDRLLTNYINWNLTDAKEQAKRYSYAAILIALYEAGYGARSAIAIASYLKGEGTFQAACDAEALEKEQKAECDCENSPLPCVVCLKSHYSRRAAA